MRNDRSQGCPLPETLSRNFVFTVLEDKFAIRINTGDLNYGEGIETTARTMDNVSNPLLEILRLEAGGRLEAGWRRAGGRLEAGWPNLF